MVRTAATSAPSFPKISSWSFSHDELENHAARPSPAANGRDGECESADPSGLTSLLFTKE